jgi:hypothetical protein
VRRLRSGFHRPSVGGLSLRSRLSVRSTAPGLAVVFSLAALAAPAAAQAPDDRLVNVGSPPTPFSQNKQNEPAVAVDQNDTNVVVAGSNDNIDMEPCNSGPDNTCPFTPGVGVSGVYFSFNRGQSWQQPTYTGLTARHCPDTPGDDPGCTPQAVDIGTLPNYAENDLVSDGDPALAFGPQPIGRGRFSETKSRLYYANLTSAVPGTGPFKGDEAIAVSHSDNVQAAAAGDEAAWGDPVIASRQSGAQFSDKEQIWADNAQSSDFYGNVYVCYAAFRGRGNGFTNQPLDVLTSRDGGDSWTQHQVTPATNNVASRNGFGRSGCTVRTDSNGVVYVFDFQFGFSPTTSAEGQIQMIKSFDGGVHWQRPVSIFNAFDTCNAFEPAIGRCVEDGVGGARSDLSPAPSVDIANGAPTGAGADDRIVISWVDGRDGLNKEHVMFSTSTDRGLSWDEPTQVEEGRDRGYYSAPSISPDGDNVYLVYNAFTEDFKDSAVGAANDRPLVGQVLHATVSDGTVGDLAPVHRGTPGDARGSSQNDLAAEFLGDYVYAAATDTYGTAVWNDVRNAADCDAVDKYRQALHDEAVDTGTQTAEAEEPRGEQNADPEPDADAGPVAPAPEQACPATFGNSDIFGWTSAP